MVDDNRKNQILQILKSQRYASVNDLSEQLFVSGATIRRELNALEKSRQIQRTRGGAYLIEGSSFEDPYAIRERQNVTEKQIIAGQAIKQISDGMTVFMDSSSTVYIMAQMMDDFKSLTVITNSLKTALCLAAKAGITVLCACGRPRAGTVSLIGQSTVDYLRSFNADAAFLSACGFDDRFGSSEASVEEAPVKKTYIEQAKKRYLLCDTTKMGKVFICRTASLDAYSEIITEDRRINARYHSLLHK